MNRILLTIMTSLVCMMSYAGPLDSLETVLKEKMLVQERVYIHTDNNCYFVGDTLWYKAYVVRSDNLQPTNYSKILYVELLTPDGYLVERQQLYIKEDGTAACQFALTDSLYSGYYEVRAYTKWQLNFNRKTRPHSTQNRFMFYSRQFENEYFREYEDLYSRVFPIYEKPQKAGDYSNKCIFPRPKQRIYADKPALKVTFYPEGGHIIKGIDSRVAFEVTDNDGQAQDITGALNDGLYIKATHNGRGIFEYSGAKAPTQATFEYMGKKYTYDLPKAVEAGVTLRHTPSEGNKQTFSITAKGITPAAYSHLCRGKLVSFVKDGVGESITLEGCPTGINELIIYDGEARPLASRLFFVDNHDITQPIELTMKADGKEVRDTTTLAPYAKVSMEVRASGTVSVAVHDKASQDDSYDDGNMLTDLLLTGELKGFVANAAQYFKPGAEDNLDLLMMVQGWRRYKPVFKIYNLPETCMSYEGQVLNVPSNANIIEITDIDDMSQYGNERSNYVLVSPLKKNSSSSLSYSNWMEMQGRLRGGVLITETQTQAPTLSEVTESEESSTTDVAETDTYSDDTSYDTEWVNYKKFKNKKNIVVEGEIVKGKETGDVKAPVDERGFFKINLPWFVDQAILFLTAYPNGDSLKLGLNSVKNSKRMQETEYPKYYIKRQMDFPIFCDPYSWYQCNVPENACDAYFNEDDEPLGPENNRLAGEHYLQNVTVRKFRKAKRGLNYNKPAIVMDAYKLYNDMTDYGLSYGVLDMTRFTEQAATYLFGYLDQATDAKIRGLINDNKTAFFRNYVQTSSEHDVPMATTAMLPLLRLNKMKNIRAYTDYDRRNGTHLEVDGAAAVTISIEPMDGKRYTYRDRRYVLDGITYAEECYQPDYSNVKPQEPTDYRRTLYWNPYAKADDGGTFKATFYNNSRDTRIETTVSGKLKVEN